MPDIPSVVGADPLAARERAWASAVEVVLERTTGLASRTVGQIGPAQLEIQRVYVHGSF